MSGSMLGSMLEMAKKAEMTHLTEHIDVDDSRWTISVARLGLVFNVDSYSMKTWSQVSGSSAISFELSRADLKLSMSNDDQSRRIDAGLVVALSSRNTALLLLSVSPPSEC